MARIIPRLQAAQATLRIFVARGNDALKRPSVEFQRPLLTPERRGHP